MTVRFHWQQVEALTSRRVKGPRFQFPRAYFSW